MKWRNRLAWAAPVGLALVVVCSGCFMLFAFAITARGELTASALGSDWRVWQLQQKNTNGLGVSQTSGSAPDAGPACRRTRGWLITWRPTFQVETSIYDDCGGQVGHRATETQSTEKGNPQIQVEFAVV